MNNYELYTVLSGTVTPAKKKSASEAIEKRVKTAKGKVAKVNDWGVIDLAYNIDGNTTGVFLVFELELDGKAASELNRNLRVESDVIRYLLIRKD